MVLTSRHTSSDWDCFQIREFIAQAIRYVVGGGLSVYTSLGAKQYVTVSAKIQLVRFVQPLYGK